MTASRPTIGVTTYAANEQQEITLPVDYISAVRRAGGVPILIPPGEQQLDQLLELVDGLVLAGGGDVSPSCYGGPPHETIYMVDQARDEMELRMARRVIERQLPTLAICRGLQIVNVALGGSLHPHIPDVFGQRVLHRAPPRLPIPHEVSIQQASWIADIMGAHHASPMSWHHQALRDVAAPLRVAAYAPDGVIEAAEMPSHRWLVGVQWHPEITANQDEGQQRLFDELIRQAKRG